MHYIVLFVGFLLLAGCTSPQTPQLPGAEQLRIADLHHYPQNAAAYAQNISNRDLPRDIQHTYKSHYFLPWSMTEPPEKLEAVMWPFRIYKAEGSYGENLKLLPQSWFDYMLEQANFDAYGTLNRTAITLHFSHLRNFPTVKPLFKDPKQAGEGFPFDYLQNSGIHANEPLFVSHYSRDGAWVYVFTAYATGWLPAHSIAYMTKRETRSWQEARQLHLINEGYPIKDSEGRFLFYGRLGIMLPLIDVEEDHYRVWTVTAGANNAPTFTEAEIPKYAGREEVMPLNQQTLPQLANEVMQSHYGWGGMYTERDCSSTLRDMYAPFGIWLPRNSFQQANTGRVFSLEGMERTQKLAFIKDKGIPFETLLYRKGHILLYLGIYEGEVMVLHNMWGVRTKDGDHEGRLIVGKTVISTLDIGSEQTDYDEESNMLEKLESMNIITEGEQSIVQ